MVTQENTAIVIVYWVKSSIHVIPTGGRQNLDHGTVYHRRTRGGQAQPQPVSRGLGRSRNQYSLTLKRSFNVQNGSFHTDLGKI